MRSFGLLEFLSVNPLAVVVGYKEFRLVKNGFRNSNKGLIVYTSSQRGSLLQQYVVSSLRVYPLFLRSVRSSD